MQSKALSIRHFRMDIWENFKYIQETSLMLPNWRRQNEKNRVACAILLAFVLG